MALGFLLLVSLLKAAVTTLSETFDGDMTSLAMQVASFFVSFAVIALLFALIVLIWVC